MKSNFISLLLLSLMLFQLDVFAQYTGSGTVSQGIGSITNANIYSCPNGRIPNVGIVTATDASVWTMPAEVNYLNANFPFASNLYNACVGANYTNANAALAALNGNDIITIDSTGELITAYIFADNYFELYINGVPVGKDNVPYTEFNSNIVRFRVQKPFKIAMLLVDWEEYLGIGCEVNNTIPYHMGDGGIVAVFKDTSNNTVAITNQNWKAQSFYTAPIIDLNCPTENGNQRLSNNCSTADANDGTNYYALHWSKPLDWMDSNFNDAVFPQASIYSNQTVGVNNKPAYTNFTNIFDDPVQDAQFIWSTNLILDNEVVVTYTVPAPTSLSHVSPSKNKCHVYPNPANNSIYIKFESAIAQQEVIQIILENIIGEQVFIATHFVDQISLDGLPNGIYTLKIISRENQITEKIIKQ